MYFKRLIQGLLFSFCASLLGDYQYHVTDKQSSDELIVSATITKSRLAVVINPEFKDRYLVNDFFVEYEDEDVDLTKLDGSLVLMPFLCNVVTIVWISGKKYFVDSMDEDLYHSFARIKKVFQKLYPKTSWDGDIIPRKIVKNTDQRAMKDPHREIALLYSAGLDSTSSSFYHSDKKQLLITACGQWDIPLEEPDLWEKRKRRMVHFARKYGHTNSFLKSNYVSFLNWEVLGNLSPEIYVWREDANEGIGMAGIAAPILLAKGYTELLIASSFTWNYPYPYAANPLVDNNIHFAEIFSVKHDQFSFSRIDKIVTMIRIIKEKKMDIPFMKVCAGQQNYNCCKAGCNKCLQTIMALLILGQDPFPWGFDISPDEALSRIKEYLKTDLSYWIRWNFLCMKKKIQRMLSQHKSVPKNVRWLLDVPLDGYTVPLNESVTFKPKKFKEFVNWPQFKELAPSSVVIPPHIKQLRLVEETKDILWGEDDE